VANFLWVEDFPGDNSTRSTTEAVFGKYLHSLGVTIQDLSEDARILREQLKVYGIFIETSFFDGYRFINNKLSDVDYVVLDIDLPCHGDYLKDYEESQVIGLLSEWEYLNAEDYDHELKINEAKAELKKIAGYHLYTELLNNLGFPKENVIFCSNHGEELNTIKEAFSHAKITMPQMLNKSETTKLQRIIEGMNNNQYFALRRGVFLASKQFKPALDKKTHITRFSQQWAFDHEIYKNDYFDNYLSLLELILPMREPKKEKKQVYYKLLLRSLVQNWDQTAEKIEKREHRKWYALVKVLNSCRNWAAHNRRIFASIPESFLAFILLIHMRATFKGKNELAPFERLLLPLLAEPIREEEIHYESINETLNSYYQEVKILSDEKDCYYDKLINSLQEDLKFKPPKNAEYDAFFQTSLYRMLWFVQAQDSPSNNFKYPNLKHKESDLDMFIVNLERYLYPLCFPNN